MRDVSLLYGPVRNWVAVAGAALIAVLIGFVATGSAEQRQSCEAEGETLDAAEVAFGSSCDSAAAGCEATAGAWRCSTSKIGIGHEGEVRRSTSPQWQSPDLIFAAGGTAIWTAIATPEPGGQLIAEEPAAEGNKRTVTVVTGRQDQPTSPICTAGGPTLQQAQQTNTALCSAPRADCEPSDAAWVCSSDRIDEGSQVP